MPVFKILIVWDMPCPTMVLANYTILKELTYLVQPSSEIHWKRQMEIHRGNAR